MHLQGNCTKYPLHHVTYSATKFEGAMSNRLEGDIDLQENTFFDTWGQGHKKYYPERSTSCELFSYKA